MMYVATSSPGQYINDDKARLPYSKTEEYGLKIDGLPANCALKHPSSYGKSTLRNILDNRENLKLYGEKVRHNIMLAASIHVHYVFLCMHWHLMCGYTLLT